jgi:hypothetical protein
MRPFPRITVLAGLAAALLALLAGGCGEDDERGATASGAPVRCEGGSKPTGAGRCLPADFPAWRFQSVRPAPPGLFTVSLRASKQARPWVIVFDEQGRPRWWHSPGTRALWAQILSDGTIAWARSFGDGYGLDPRMAHEIRSEDGRLLRLVRTRGPIVDGHELRELADGNLLVASYAPETADLRRVGGPAEAAVVSAEIQELDRRGRVTWRWSSRTDAVYGIRRSTGEIAWKLGGSETPESLRVVGDPARKLFGGQHDARIAADGSLSVYDNGKDRPRRPRVVFYRLDLERRTATYEGQLNDAGVRTSHCCGSARQLPDGGWLVSWGDNPLVTRFDQEGRVVSRLRLAAPTFRAVPAPPGATTAAELERGLARMAAGR